MNKEKLNNILELHAKWLNNDVGGIKADLRKADLGHTNLGHANLCHADLGHANLCHANLCHANLCHADLGHTNLCHADLCYADLCHTNLYSANLYDTDLFGANLDYSSGLPLSCKGLKVKLDKKLAVQQVYHAIANIPEECFDEFLADPIAFANQFHRIPEVPIIIKGEQKDE